MMRKGVVKAAIIGVALLAVVGLAAAGFVWSRSGSPRLWPSKTFESAAWKASPKESRYVFYKDLERRRLLEGRTRDEVNSLLGVPDFQSQDGRYETFILKTADRGEYSFNSVYLLHVDFDGAGRVVRVFVRAD